MALGAIFNLLNRQAILFSILTLVISPFLTYYITTSLFYRRARSKASKKVPPTIPYYVPGIFHAFSLAYVGPQKYFAQLIKEYGDFAPFYVNAGPQSFLVLRDLKHVNKVLESNGEITKSASRLEVFDKIIGSPQNALDLYSCKDLSSTDKDALKYAHDALVQKHLTGVSLAKDMETYVSILSGNLNDKMFQVGTWTQIEDSWSFLQQVVTRCTLASLFGTDLFKQYPSIIKDYWEFADAVEGFIPGLPRYWVPGAASQVRDRLHCGIEKWLKANHSGSEFARLADEDPAWDNLKGSKFIQERDQVLANIEGMGFKGRAAEMLDIMHESCSNLIPRSFWTLVEVIRRPALVKSLTTSITRYCPSQDAVHNIAGITELPLIQSIQAEVERLRTAKLGVLNNEVKSFELDDEWIIPKGTPIVLLSNDVSMNSKAWEMIQPRTVQVPLEEFWTERFLLPNGSVDHKALSLLVGNDPHQTLGHEYAQAIQSATLAVLLNEFELQLCEPELFDAVAPPSREVAFGTLKPLERIGVRIRKRSSLKPR